MTKSSGLLSKENIIFKTNQHFEYVTQRLYFWAEVLLPWQVLYSLLD